MSDGAAEPEAETSEEPTVVEEPEAAPETDTPPPVEPRSLSGRRVVAVAAGRGGAGKSLVAANLAIYLAQIGKRVVAIDADPAGGSLHDLLGTPRPPRGFGEILRRTATLPELIVDTPIAGIGLVAGEPAAFGALTPRNAAKPVLEGIADLDVDYVVLDLGPPSALALDLFVSADVPVLVVLPDPASIEATYRFTKSAFLRRLRATRGLDRLVPQTVLDPPAPLDLFRAASASDGPAGRLADEIAAFKPRFIVSQTRSLADLKLGAAMASAARRRLGHAFECLGHVESDESVWAAARRRRPLVAEFPESKVAKNIEKVVRRILALETERPVSVPPLRAEGAETHYEILETEPGVSDEEIRRAFRRVKDIYAEGSLAIAGLYDETHLGALHARLNAAHDTLFSPERRRAYDLGLPEADLARAVRAAAQLQAPRAVERHESTEPVLGLDEDVTGQGLRRVREARGLDISDLAQRTKISERHIRSIEEERFSDMPAAVYVRGYVMTLARALRIDPNRAAAGILRRYHEARGE